MKTYKELYTLAEQRIQSLAFDGQPRELYDPLEYMMSLGGKRLRPVLVLMASDLFGGDIEQAVPAALAVEVFHNFSLVHDDIMDNADIRRGQPTVHVKWNQTVGILSGDMMLVKAIELLCETKTERLREMLAVFNTTAIQVCEGQQIDMNFEQRADVSVEEYIGMITLKTAVLLGGALKLGAIAANASDEDAEHIYEFGKHIGIAFQIQDDILDSFGEGDQVGKKIGGDIAANKKTLLLIKALELAQGNTRAKLQQLLNDKNIVTDAKIEQMLAIYNELNVKPFADTLKQQHLRLAFEHLNKVSTDHNSKTILKDTAHELMERIK